MSAEWWKATIMRVFLHRPSWIWLRRAHNCVGNAPRNSQHASDSGAGAGELPDSILFVDRHRNLQSYSDFRYAAESFQLRPAWYVTRCHAATTIQAVCRRCCEQMQLCRAQVDFNRWQAALTMQPFIRGCLTRARSPSRLLVG